MLENHLLILSKESEKSAIEAYYQSQLLFITQR
jgi:hypothetical protein